MSKICYIPKNFGDVSQQIIDDAADILDEYHAQGFTMTLRQIYYKFVGRGLFPDHRRWSKVDGKWVKDPNGTKNADPNYKWLGDIINDARLAGDIDWYRMQDPTRHLSGFPSWESPHEIIQGAARGYSIDKWIGQEYRPEVWVEKEALEGIVARACGAYQVPHFSCRGYTSQSAMFSAGNRLIHNIRTGYKPFIIHLGDHDPSGMDMSKDIEGRLFMYVDKFEDASQVGFKRIALNMDQIKRFNPPSDPAKPTDSRSPRYVQQYGENSWELDALEPNDIIKMIHEQVDLLVDQDMYQRKVDQEEDERGDLTWVAENWDDIQKG